MDCVCYGMFVVHFDGVNGVSVVFERMCVCVYVCGVFTHGRIIEGGLCCGDSFASIVGSLI